MFNKEKICRACLIEKDSFTYSLFVNISCEEYQYCTSIQVFEDDIFPTSLCNTCYNLLNKLSEFKRMCIQSQNVLLTMKSSSLLHERSNETLRTQHKTENNYDCDVAITETHEEFVDQKNICLKIEYTDDGDNNFVTDRVSEGNDKSEDLQVNLKTENLVNNDFCNDIAIKNKTETKCNKRLAKSVKFKDAKFGLKLKSKRKHFKFSCQTCNRKFDYLETYEAHKLEHEGKVLPIRCIDCKKQFRTWSGLRRHAETEHSVVSLESLRCGFCGKICKSRQTLRMHRKLHDTRVKWICHMCGKWCATSYNLKIHQETHSDKRDKSFTCEHCGKKFYSNNLLKAHIRKLHQEQRYICHICNYPFKYKHNLAIHLPIHDGKKLHSCNVCDKSFGSRSTLIEHTRIHSGERPYSCLYCPNSFLSKRRLDDHHRTHTGERPFKCNICERGYAQRGTLKRHMKIHTKTIPANDGT